jgi:hypothetical protein
MELEVKAVWDSDSRRLDGIVLRFSSEYSLVRVGYKHEMYDADLRDSQ